MWVTDRFRALADEAGVRIQGEPSTLQYGRRFWYDTFKDAVSELIELANEVAEEQGSKDPRSVYENYWSEDERRRLRRDAMQRKLERAFEMNGRANDGA